MARLLVHRDPQDGWMDGWIDGWMDASSRVPARDRGLQSGVRSRGSHARRRRRPTPLTGCRSRTRSRALLACHTWPGTDRTC
eukprot:scaffold115746_cov57-Phaeocystis_antarctica.AAC.1